MGAARGRFWVSVALVVLILAVGAIVVGALRLLDGEASAGGRRPVAASPTTAPSPSHDDEVEADDPELLADVSLIDVRTGREIPMPRSIRKVENASQFQVSPDGRLLAFTGGSALYVARVDGSRVRVLTREVPYASSPSWSPDGAEVVVNARPGIVVVRVPSGGIREVLGWRRETFRPVFSADGRDILFTSHRRGRVRTWSVPATGGRPSVSLPFAAFAAMSPDGTSIAYRRTAYDGMDPTEMTSSHVFVADPDGRHEMELGAGGFWMSQIDPERLWPTWSPDGTRLVFQRDAAGPVQIADLSTGHLMRIGEGENPTWLDDDTLIIESYQPARRADR